MEMMLGQEGRSGVTKATFYAGFQPRAEAAKNALIAFPGSKRTQAARSARMAPPQRVIPCSISPVLRADLLPYVADRNPTKQGKYLPGSRIPIVDERLFDLRSTRLDNHFALELAL